MNETTQKLTAAMVAAYPNARVMYRTDLDGEGVIGKVWGLNFQRNELVAKVENSWVDMQDDIDKFQLVLTSHANITDAQALEIRQEYWTKDQISLKSMIELIKELSDDTFDWRSRCAVELSDVCRSENIDMGYKGIPSLIAAGLAVEKEVGNE